MAERRSLAVPRYRHCHERAFGPDGLDARVAMHLRLTGGVFVESRARDGMQRSNTLLFARYRGWKGVLVEPDPALAQRCRALRPESIVERARLIARGHASPTVASSEPEEAPARTLSAILDVHGVERVDLLCLDREGDAPTALRGLDLDRHRPAWMLVEVSDRPTIEELVAPWYDPVFQLSDHDVLYRARRPRRAGLSRA